MRFHGPFFIVGPMKTSDLIRHFSERTSLPVDVNDVLTVLRANGADDDVEFIGVDLDPEILQGKIKVFYARPLPYAEPVRFANIYYHRGHSPDWQRFICCKELMHILDPESAQTKEIAEIDQLAEKIGLPPEMQDPMADGFATNVDRLAEYRGAAILFPKACRDILLEPFGAGLLTVDDIARMADIPRKYVGFMMRPVWDAVHALLVA
jgi:hypothetical protein